MADKLNDNVGVLAGGIAEYLRDQRAARADKQPLPKPAILDDPKADPVKRDQAAQSYGEALLRRKTLTSEEMTFLGKAIHQALNPAKE